MRPADSRPCVFQECMLSSDCLVAALSHGDGVVALLRVVVGVPVVSSHSVQQLQLSRRDSLLLAPRVDGVADEEGGSEVGDLGGEAADTPEEVALEGTLEGLLGEGRDGCGESDREWKATGNGEIERERERASGAQRRDEGRSARRKGGCRREWEWRSVRFGARGIAMQSA
jgi:hypothetical protein